MTGSDKRSSGHTQSKTPPQLTPSPQTPTPQARYVPVSDIPRFYGVTRIRALPRDPWWIFVYWEIADIDLDSLRQSIGDAASSSARHILRIVDVTDIIYDGTNAWRRLDMEIDRATSSWYAKVDEPNRNYVVEYGLLTESGEYRAVAASNMVSMPRVGVSELTDERWHTVSADHLLRFSAQHTGGETMADGSGSGFGSWYGADTHLDLSSSALYLRPESEDETDRE